MYFEHTKSRKPLVRRVIYCTHKGRCRELQGSWHHHAQYMHEMIYADYGALRILQKEISLSVRAGECLFLRGGIAHALESDVGLPFNYLNLMFCGSVPDVLFNQPLSVGGYGLSLIERLTRESGGTLPYHYDSVIGSLTELIVHMLRQLPTAQPAAIVEPAYLRHQHSVAVNRALAIIQQHYAKPLTRKQTSRAAGISTSHLHVLLKKETGASFNQLLQTQRIEAAKHLLQDSPLALGQIAAAVGYNSASFFFKLFKRSTGMTPAEFARSLGEPATRT